MEYLRKQAKALVRAHRAGERRAVERAAAVLGERAHERFRLSDAQHVVAREQGHRSWPDLVHATDPREVVIDSGLAYVNGHRVLVRVRKRGRRYMIDDDGAAVAKAGWPPGWFPVAERVVAEDYLNLNRRGVVFVPAVEGGLDLASLVLRIADRSAAVYQELIELDE